MIIVKVDYIQPFYHIILTIPRIKLRNYQIFNVEINPFQLKRTLDETITS